MDEEAVGTVVHYFARPQVAAVKLSAELAVGDHVEFRGHTTCFEQQVASMQIEHEQVEKAGSGADVGIQVGERVRKGDKVYRVAD